ncbi:hypothetical protein MNBD_GAMMA21-2164 [hydrothermal vent metagenome]|uniref:DUF302 domain-containing protein n=1 Tax=hydrothermal vent metagenome TaxID=652676 RepID=A0A3B0ZVQ6_9ZZZZ
MKLTMLRVFALLVGLSLTAASVAEDIFMTRTQQTFPEAMLELQQKIKSHGYTLSRVQRVDIGLTKSGYKTDKYRVVFFGKAEEIKWVGDTYPEWVPYLPLKIAIFSEAQDTLLITSDPEKIFFSEDAKFKKIISQWKKDISSIFHEMAD